MNKSQLQDESFVELFSTAPQSSDSNGRDYASRLAEVARWSEEAGCTGMLIYSDNSVVDPWLLAHLIIANSAQLSPLVALQPAYMHPFTAAKMVASLSYLYGRRVSLNLIAGGFRKDLLALCDNTAHDQRYARLIEYVVIVKSLLSLPGPFSYCGQYYQVSNLTLRPALQVELFPRLLISGSSVAGRQAAESLHAVSIEYPEPGARYDQFASPRNAGIRIGIIAADRAEDAWDLAHRRFPIDRAGELKHLLAMRESDSRWHKQLSQLPSGSSDGSGVYWLRPFKNYNTFCPYLVGSHEQVSDELVTYIAAGFRTFILDIPREEGDLHNAARTFDLAAAKFASRAQPTRSTL